MRPEYYAVLTAMCWSFGSLMEKQGLKQGNLTPVLGAGVRTVVSLVILTAVSFRYWPQLRTCGVKPILLVAIGGGVLSGALGITTLFAGLKGGNIAVVVALAFCLTPVIGGTLGHFLFKQGLSALQILGICLCVGGAALVLLAHKG